MAKSLQWPKKAITTNMPTSPALPPRMQAAVDPGE
jgi:hypothetical protein